MSVTISERTQAISALEAERQKLYIEAELLNAEQECIAYDMHRQLKHTSDRHHVIIAKMVALDDAVHQLLIGN